MLRAISLHVGLNRVDPTHYGTSAPLRGCVNDANDMQTILKACGFETHVLLNDVATSASIFSALDDAARLIDRDGIFVLTYSGHGSQLKDLDGDEFSGQDQTICVYDRMIIDDELYAHWKKFAPGARIVVIADSCHSGTIAREMFANVSADTGILNGLADAPVIARNLPEPALNFVRANWLDVYRNLHAGKRDIAPDELVASLIQISGCQDNQTSGDLPTNGIFTGALIDVWANGQFTGGYSHFHEAIRCKMPKAQNPNYWAFGAPNRTFESQKPFTIEQRDVQPAEGDAHMATLHPAVEQLMRKKNGAAKRGLDVDVDVEAVRDISGSCTITIGRDVIAGKSDREILDYFSQIVAPEICSNYFSGRDAFSGKVPRGGDISCSVDTHGNVGCTGTWHF